MGQHGDSEQGPDKAQAVLIINLQDKKFWMLSPPTWQTSNHNCIFVQLSPVNSLLQCTDVQLPSLEPPRAARCPLRKALGGEGADPTSVLFIPAAEKSSSPLQR